VTERGLVTDEERPGRVTFKTETEKNTKALKEFEVVVRDFPRSKEAKIARYYIGLTQFQLGHKDQAQKDLEKLAGEGNDSVGSLARLELADVYSSMGKEEEARKVYDYLIKNPSDMVSENRALLAKAQYLSARNPEEARKLLNDLIRRPGTIAAAAGNVLRELGNQ